MPKKARSSSTKAFVVRFKPSERVRVPELGLAASLEAARALAPADRSPAKRPQDNQTPTSAFEVLHKQIEKIAAKHRGLSSLIALLHLSMQDLNFMLHLKPDLQKYGADLVHSDTGREIYAVHNNHIPDVFNSIERMYASIEVTLQLPRLLLIGLVSDYDTFLQKLIRAALLAQPHKVKAINRSLQLADLPKFQTVQEAIDHLIDCEIDAIMKCSHKKQIEKLNGLFDLKLDLSDSCVVKFLEICARRNVHTHNSGIANQQYFRQCEEAGFDVKEVKVGDLLKISNAYFEDSISITQELKTKICQYIWRKMIPDDRDRADQMLNQLCFELLSAERYDLARKLLEYGITKTKPTTDLTKRMLIVNYANALKLLGRQKDAKKQLEDVDWSATHVVFQISVAAVLDDCDRVVKLMKEAAKHKDFGDAKESLRRWPVFHTVKQQPAFQDRFKELFGEDLILDQPVTPHSRELNETSAAEMASEPGRTKTKRRKLH